MTVDSRFLNGKKGLFIALKGQRVDGHSFIEEARDRGCRYALVSKKLQCKGIECIEVDSPLNALQSLAKDYRKTLSYPLIALIGSYGKTQVKGLLNTLLQRKYHVSETPDSFNSQIGVPLALLHLPKTSDFALIEAAASHPGELEKLASIIAPTHTLITPIGTKYQENFLSKSAFENSFKDFLKFQDPKGIIFAPSFLKVGHIAWDQHLSHLPHFFNDKILFSNGKELSCAIRRENNYVPNLYNMALKVAATLNIDEECLYEEIKNFIHTRQRTETWIGSSGATFINTVGGKHSLTQISQRLHLENRPKLGEKYICSSLKQLKEKAPLLRPGDTLMIQGDQKIPFGQIIKEEKRGSLLSWCEISLSAIKKNIDAIKKQLPVDVKVMAMIKASGYGTDGSIIARYLQQCGVTSLGLSYVEEAVQLRENGINTPLFVIHALPEEAFLIQKYQLEVAVNNKALIQALGRQQEPIDIHLNIDTGMGRLGIDENSLEDLLHFIKKYPNLRLLGLMSHLAAAENPQEDAFTQQQIAQFKTSVDKVLEQGFNPQWIHLGNTSGAIRFNLASSNLVRLGVGMYGIAPSETVAARLKFTPALSLYSKIASITEREKGSTIGYGRTHILTKKSIIGTLPIGYADGLSRKLSNRGHVMVRGQLAPIIGSVCMDYLMVDLTHIPDVQIGDDAEIFGDNIKIEHYSSLCETIPYESICLLGSRVLRIFTEEDIDLI